MDKEDDEEEFYEEVGDAMDKDGKAELELCCGGELLELLLGGGIGLC